jgi:hypothetical protein
MRFSCLCASVAAVIMIPTVLSSLTHRSRHGGGNRNSNSHLTNDESSHIIDMSQLPSLNDQDNYSWIAPLSRLATTFLVVLGRFLLIGMCFFALMTPVIMSAGTSAPNVFVFALAFSVLLAILNEIYEQRGPICRCFRWAWVTSDEETI